MRTSKCHPALNYVFVCALGLATAGCVSRTPYVDNEFGNAFNQLKAQQILNPKAASTADPGTGVDAQAAKSGYDAYQKSYRAPEPPPAFTIGIGGGSTR